MSTRREFLTTAAGAVPVVTAASYRRILGANEKIRLGVIGPGQRGTNRMLSARALGAEIVGLADCNRGLLES